MSPSKLIICDLDGTLIHTDLLWESIILLIRQRFYFLFLLPVWFLKKGKSGLKDELARRVQPRADLLPYNESVLEYLKEEKDAGAELVLASASHEIYVEAVARHLGIFHHVMGSTARENLKGRRKLARIQETFPGRPFSYIGDSKADLPLWEVSQEVLVAGSHRLGKDGAKSRRQFEVKRGGVAFFKALRPHQWSKNILLMLPLFLSHQIDQPKKILSGVVAFFLFSFCASSFYLLNDMMDLEADRQHHKKKRRPFASGRLSIPQGLALFLLTLTVSLTGAIYFVNLNFLIVLLAYSFLTVAYSWYLKRKLIVDVIVLSLFYTLRIYGGGVAMDVEVTNWLLAFSTFFFLSLGFVKRYVELMDLKAAKRDRADSRNYFVDESNLVQSSGIASGFMSVLVFFLYITNSTQVLELYTRPVLLWLIGPVLIYWIVRIWFLAQRGAVDSDPVFYAIKDRNSWIMVLAVVILVMAASL